MAQDIIPFNKPYLSGKEHDYMKQVTTFAGDGVFTKQCHRWLQDSMAVPQALLTHSCTAALEMAALLLNIQPGDEIIMPSYTFVSTANAFVLRGAVPVFVDVREDTLNIDERLIEAAITSKTKAIVPVHYAGVSCEMDIILALAKVYKLSVVEDAAQGVMASYKGHALGSLGQLGAFSFHETKNIISGEGGALLINDPVFSLRAEMIREKGTDRSRFFRGEVDKYTWQVVGSSFLPSDLMAAFLYAQLEAATAITSQRLAIWERYHEALAPLEAKGLVRRPIIPEGCQHNAHMYYVILPAGVDRQYVLAELKSQNIYTMFHYVPLHTSPGGMHYGRAHGGMNVTNKQSERLIRLPLWVGLTAEQQMRVIDALTAILVKHTTTAIVC